VPGDREYFWGGNEWLTVINNLGIINLVNRGKVVNSGSQAVLVAGVADPASNLPADLFEVVASGHGEATALKILLSNRPATSREANKAGFHLQLSSRSFTGPFFPRRDSSGLKEINGFWLHLAPVTGLHGSFLRLWFAPELTLISLHRGRTQDSLRPAPIIEMI
jgi:hypothetical protein